MRPPGTFVTKTSARGCCPTLSIRFSRPEMRAILLVCRDDHRPNRKPNMSGMIRMLVLADPRIQAALLLSEKGLDRGRVAHST